MAIYLLLFTVSFVERWRKNKGKLFFFGCLFNLLKPIWGNPCSTVAPSGRCKLAAIQAFPQKTATETSLLKYALREGSWKERKKKKSTFLREVACMAPPVNTRWKIEQSPVSLSENILKSHWNWNMSWKKNHHIYIYMSRAHGSSLDLATGV